MKQFIEIGSCDFDTNLDLIKTGRWHGIFVEPSKLYRNNLKELIKKEEFSFNCIVDESVISDYDGKIEFTNAKDTSTESRALGSWRRGIGSVTADNHIGERLFDLANNDKFIDSVEVLPCMTLDSLIKKYGIKKLDYLKIDVEGHELNILKSYSWDILPDIIKLEHSHCDDVFLKNLLESHGYMVYVEQSDIYALR